MLAISSGQGQGQGASVKLYEIKKKKKYNRLISFSINHYLFLGEGWRVRLEK